MAPIGFKLGQNSFQMIPDISFFDARKKKIDEIFGAKKSGWNQKSLFWRSYAGLSTTGSSVSKNDPRWNHFRVCATFGGGVKVVSKFFFVIFGQNGLSLYMWFDDMMIWKDDESSLLEMTKCLDWNIRNILIGTQETSWLKHKNVLIETQEMSWLKHKKCLDWNTGNVLTGPQETFCVRAAKSWIYKNCYKNCHVFKT